MVEEMLNSEVWKTIGEVLIDEGIASVAGRKTNGRWHHGSFTRANNEPLPYLQGYQRALMDFSNRLIDFVKAKDDLDKKKKESELERHQPFINPFLEEDDDYSEK